MSFKKELKDLLEKYNASIGFECADCSDLHGVYEERIVVSVSDGRKETEILSVDGYYIDKHNI
jgi:hypothetical protein